MKKPHKYWAVPLSDGLIQVVDMTTGKGEVIDSPLKKEFSFEGSLTEFRKALKKEEDDERENSGIGRREA